ncbi:MAG: PilN domain-containing protein [Sedimenticola sp.]
MARINLLPWRETLRKKRQRDFGSATLLAAIITGALCGGVHFYIEDMISHQQARNDYLKREIALVDKRIREIKELEKIKTKLIARMNVIQSLQGSRPQIVHLFDELVSTMPEGAHLSKLAQKGGNITLDGRAQSNARVSAYMRNIEGSEWLKSPSLQVVQSKDKVGTAWNQFTLTAKQAAAKGVVK